MKTLIRKCYKKDYNYNPDYNFEKTKVYEVLSDEFQLLFWNSSNSNRIDDQCLEDIAEQLENREIFYQKAMRTVQGKNLMVDELVDIIRTQILH